MPDREMDCLADADPAAKPLRAVRPAGLPVLLDALPEAQARFVRDAGFTAAAGSILLLPGPDGVAGALLGLGAAAGPHVWGGLPFGLPEGGAWSIEASDGDPAEAVLGFCLGAYRFELRDKPSRAPGAAGAARRLRGGVSRPRGRPGWCAT